MERLQEDELEEYKLLCGDQAALIDKLQAEKSQMAIDLEQLAERVQDQDTNMEDQVYDVLSVGRKNNKVREIIIWRLVA